MSLVFQSLLTTPRSLLYKMIRCSMSINLSLLLKHIYGLFFVFINQRATYSNIIYTTDLYFSYVDKPSLSASDLGSSKVGTPQKRCFPTKMVPSIFTNHCFIYAGSHSCWVNIKNHSRCTNRFSSVHMRPIWPHFARKLHRVGNLNLPCHRRWPPLAGWSFWFHLVGKENPEAFFGLSKSETTWRFNAVHGSLALTFQTDPPSSLTPR